MGQYWWKKAKPNAKGEDVYVIYGFDANGKKRTRTFVPPKGLTPKVLQRRRDNAIAEFHQEIREGKVLTVNEAKEQARQQAAEKDKLLTVERYANTVYMPKKVITIAENTRDSYERNLRLYVFPAIGNKLMSEVKTADITALLNNMQRKGKAHSSVIKVYNVLNNMFKEAYRDDTISVNPMPKVERPKPTKAERTNKGVEAFTVEELKRIKRLMEDEPLKWRTYTNLIIDTGCRNGEAVGLTWNCIDFENNTVTLERNVCYTQAKGIYIDTIKNGKTRTNSISPYTAKLLQEMRKEQADKGIVSPWVFTQDTRGEVMHPQTPGRFLSRFGKRNGIEICRPHKFRHTVASILINNNENPNNVADMLGDNVSTIERIYVHTDEAARSKTFARLQDILNGE